MVTDVAFSDDVVTLAAPMPVSYIVLLNLAVLNGATSFVS